MARAVLDTGATGSYIAQYCAAAKDLVTCATHGVITIRTADKRCLLSDHTIDTTVFPAHLPHAVTQLRLLVIPERFDLMGQDIVLGLDALKALNVKFETDGQAMIASIDGIEIARDLKLDKHGLFSMTIDENASMFDELVEQFSDIFAESAQTFIDTEPMTIPLAVDFSKKAKLRPHSIEDVLEINQQVRKMIENDIVEPSESDFSANVLLVAKKNGTKRLVVDFRFLNSISIKDHYPMPQTSEMFLALHDAKYFAALDCTEGFLQIPVLPEHRYRTAFVTSFGCFHYKRCPFGYTNSPAKFQRCMNEIFEDGLFKRCVIYIDDILVFAKTEDQLLENLTWVFERCRQKCVKLKRTKCIINKSEVEFLGFKIAHNQICPVAGKYDEIGVETPTKTSHIRAILGSLNHYARFIKNYPEKTADLRRMTRKGSTIEWTPELSQRIKDLKSELAQAGSLTIPDSRSHKKVDILINPYSMEVTCFDDKDNLIGRAGATLSSAETGYTMVELQLCAIVLTYKKFHLFLRGKVTFRSTCKALPNALKATQRTDRVTRIMLQLPPDADFNVEIIPGPTPLEIVISDGDADEIFYTDGSTTGNGTKDCKASWAVLAVNDKQLSAAGFVEYHRKSSQVAEITAVLKACEIATKNNFKRIVIATDSRYVANAMEKWISTWKVNDWKDNKRKSVVNQELLKQLAEYQEKLQIKSFHVKAHCNDMYNIQVDAMAKSVLQESHTFGALVTQQPVIDQHGDPEIDIIKANLEVDPSLANTYEVFNEELYYIDHQLPFTSRKRLFVPTKCRVILLRIAHDDPAYGGHLGVKKTRAKLIGYYWPHMSRDIEKYVKSCPICQIHKPVRKPRYGFLHPIPICDIFERINVDIVGPLHITKRGNRFIITAIDSFSRYAYARAAPEVKTSDVIKFLTEEIFTKHGCPASLISDNGPQFTSSEFKRYVDSLGISHCRTVEYHPEANGLDERLNGTLVKLLKNYLKDDRGDWDIKLPWAIMLYNTTNHEATMTSPYATLFGVAPKTPLRPIPCENIDGVPVENEPAFVRIREFVKQAIVRSQEQQKKYHDRSRREHNFKVLDSVWAINHNTPRDRSKKLEPKWDGPFFVFKIIEIDGESMSVILVHEDNGKFRRCSFQDLKHVEIRPDYLNDTSDEIVQQSLPGAVFQQAALQASQEGSFINNNQQETSFDSTTTVSQTIPGHTNPWRTTSEHRSSSIITPNIDASSSSDQSASDIIIQNSSVWDELLPIEWVKNIAKKVTQPTASGQTASSNVVTYSKDIIAPSSQTASHQSHIDTHNRHHTIHDVDNTTHNTITLGQTDALNQQLSDISFSSQTVEKTVRNSDCRLLPTTIQNPAGSNEQRGQPVIQSTPLAQTNEASADNEVRSTNISNIPTEGDRNVALIDIESVERMLNPSDETPIQTRSRRAAKQTSRYQAPK